MKIELAHKLDLIQIHKDVMEINEISISAMGSYCPPHIKLDNRDRQIAVGKLFKEVGKILEEGFNSIDTHVKEQLSSLGQGLEEANGASLMLGISIIKSILEMPQHDDDLQLQRQIMGGTVFILNSSNIVVNSDLTTSGEFRIGDDG